MTEIFDNIRGIYDFSPPREELQPFIEFFSESSNERTAAVAAKRDFTVEMFPSWTPTFWINLGAPYTLTTGHGSYRIPPDSDILVLRDSTMTRHNSPADHLFSVKFIPGGLEAVLGIPQTKFIGAVVRLNQVLPATLIAQIKAAAGFGQRKSLIENFLIKGLSHRPKKDHYHLLVRDSIGSYENAAMRPNTTELASRHFVHSRTINRYFHHVIGLSPKKYLSIVRARVALAGFLANRQQFSPEAFGYYDKSHFYKAVHQFTGRRLGSSGVARH
ncbi:MAG TPA: helix-turn-helix domain-containing protein [Puia sp.]|nr:helix-turn-helix domain-containing protein [Puia sp.]